MAWYDTFSRFYDLVLERSYRAPRRSCFEALALAGSPDENKVVIDLACGTGQNFPLLIERLTERSRRLVGIDYSRGMLERAAQRTRKNRWQGVHLVQADARALSRKSLEQVLGDRDSADCVVCTLGLSVLPEWQTVFDRAFELLEPGGQFLIMDVWAERRVPQTWVVERIARADLRRQVWRPLEQASIDFELRFLRGSPHFHGGRLFMATGRKR